MRHVVRRPKQIARGLIERVLELSDERRRIDEKTSPATKIALRSLLASYTSGVVAGEPLPAIHDSGFRVFSQFDEDGVILYLLGVGGMGTRRFVDLGAGDGVYASNCANLALNLGFDGLFLEADAKKADHARRFYAEHPDTRERPPAVVQAFITRENVNNLVRRAGFEGEIDLLSIDVDGNDYWLWEALDCISPRFVVVEGHTELGLADYVMPYEPDFDWRRAPPGTPVGASPAALHRLAGQLGYRLVGSNLYGFNLCFVRNDVGAETLPRIALDELFRHGSYGRADRAGEPAASEGASRPDDA
jgi:hypothetical protein